MTALKRSQTSDAAVARKIMIPDPRNLSPVMKKKLEAALSSLGRRRVYSVFEKVRRDDRRMLDELALEAIGFPERRERNQVLDRVYEAVTDLVRARLSKVREW